MTFVNANWPNDTKADAGLETCVGGYFLDLLLASNVSWMGIAKERKKQSSKNLSHWVKFRDCTINI